MERDKLITLIEAYEKAEAIYREEVKTKGGLALGNLASEAVYAENYLNHALKEHEVVWYNGKGYALDSDCILTVFTSLVCLDKEV